MTTFKKPSRRWAIILITSAVILLVITWYFAGYMPDSTIPLSGNWPMAVMKDGRTLIVGSPGDGRWGSKPHIVGPIRFLDLTTGKETRTPLELPEITEYYQSKAKHPRPGMDNRPFLLEKSDNCPTTVAAVELSDDERRLEILRSSMYSSGSDIVTTYYVTVFDLSRDTVILDKAVPFTNYSSESAWLPTPQLTRDGHLLAWATGYVWGMLGEFAHEKYQDDGSIIVWDLDKNNERFRVSGHASVFRFSPDGKLLASCVDGERLQLNDARTGSLLHSVQLQEFRVIGLPVFSPDGKFVALDFGGAGIQVIDTSTGRQCFQAQACSPQFLPRGLMLAVVGSHLRIWNCADWSEAQNIPDGLRASENTAILALLGASPVTPHLSPIGRGNQFAVTYDTEWTNSIMASRRPGVRVLRWLGFNVPGGLGLDVIDAANGTKKTYHLDCFVGRPFVLSGAGKILVPQTSIGGREIIPYAGDTAAVWSIPPRRSYRAVAAMAGILALILVVRLVWRVVSRFRGRQQSSPSLEVQL